jgi:hypothetical protein
MKKNVILLVFVALTGVGGYLIHTNNISLSRILKKSDYSSPYGVKPSSTWENNWENERLK